MVGPGFLGAEVAAVARQMDVEVTLVDPLPVPIRRQFGDLVGRPHRDHGTTLRCGVGVARFLGSGGRVTGVELADESMLDADLVLVAVGSAPATTWLTGSGLPWATASNATSSAAPRPASPASTPPETPRPGRTPTSACGCAWSTG